MRLTENPHVRILGDGNGPGAGKFREALVGKGFRFLRIPASGEREHYLLVAVVGQKFHLSASEDYPANLKTPYTQVPGYAIVDRFEDNVDLGMKLNDGVMTLSGSYRRSNYTQPKGNAGQNIDQRSLFHHLGQTFNYAYGDLQFTPQIGPVKFTLRHYFDYSTYESWQLTASPSATLPAGKVFSLDWGGSRAGIEYSGLYSFDRGDLLVGFSAERRQMDDSYFRANYQIAGMPSAPPADSVIQPQTPLVPAGVEYNGAGFAQVQYALFSFLRVNAGARYDAYQGFGDSFNPRVAVILSPISDLTAKFIYAKAFQAPTYFYRKSNPALGYGSSDDLKPEVMNSFQASLRYAKEMHWSGEITYFYDKLTNLITRDASVTPNIYKNIGENVMEGVEAEGKVRFGQLQGFLNYTLQAPVVNKTVSSQVMNGALKYVAMHMGNAGVTYRPISKVSLNVTAHAEGKTYTPTPYDPENAIGPRLLASATVAVEDVIKGLRLAGSVYNLTDKQYELGGTGVSPYPQAGRWFLFTGEYVF